MEWTEKDTIISEISTLLENGYEVEIDSPDGFVPVKEFVNKGMFITYELHINGIEPVVCSGGHYFLTNLGWNTAENLDDGQYHSFLTRGGYKLGRIIKTQNFSSIVDVSVDHPNHRYYSNDVVSHNTGKTLFLCHLAASYLAQGKTVLYITLEMSEEEIARRIDTNLLNVSFEDLEALSKDLYMKKFQKLKNKTDGKLIIKEYPSTTASIDHFRALVNEISLKQNFKPDVILIDYLNLCASSRLKASAASDTYTYIKAVAEEVRGLAKQLGIPFWSATQLNRVGFGSSDPDMTNVSESFGLPATVDLLFVLIVSEELKKLNQIMVKQLKNRYDDMDKNKRFVLGVDKSKMKLYDTEQSSQVEIDDSGQDDPVMDKSKFHDRENKFKRLKV